MISPKGCTCTPEGVPWWWPHDARGEVVVIGRTGNWVERAPSPSP